MSMTNPDLLTGLAGFWKLSEASGSRLDSGAGALDLSENGTVASGSFNPEFNPTQFGGTVARFTGTAVCLQRTNATDLHYGNSNFTVSVWVQFGVLAGTMVPIGKYYAETSGFNWGIQFSNGYLSFVWGTGPSAGGADVRAVTFTYVPVDVTHYQIERPFSTGTWYHIVGQHIAGSGIRICLNNGTMSNVKWPFVATTGFMASSTSRFAIGSRDSSAGVIVSPLTGRVSSVGVWDRLLSDGEVGWLYNGGYALDYPFTIG